MILPVIMKVNEDEDSNANSSKPQKERKSSNAKKTAKDNNAKPQKQQNDTESK